MSKAPGSEIQLANDLAQFLCREALARTQNARSRSTIVTTALVSLLGVCAELLIQEGSDFSPEEGMRFLALTIIKGLDEGLSSVAYLETPQ